jgi:SpoIIAA-like
MSFQLQIEETPGYHVARFTGTGTVEEAWRQFELIAENSKCANKNKLLLDFTEAHAEISFADRYFLVKEMRIFERHKVVKVAVVGRPEQLDYKKFGEIVALNQGVNGRVFTNVEDAEEWLLE